MDRVVRYSIFWVHQKAVYIRRENSASKWMLRLLQHHIFPEKKKRSTKPGSGEGTASRPVDRPQASLTSPRNGRSRSLAYVKKKEHKHTLYGADQRPQRVQTTHLFLYFCAHFLLLLRAFVRTFFCLPTSCSTWLATSAAAAELVFSVRLKRDCPQAMPSCWWTDSATTGQQRGTRTKETPA